MTKTAIIGGGIMGMTLALRLSKQGHTVTLFEAAPDLGGLTAAWEIGGFTWDKFYHVILLSDLKTRELLRELNLEQEIEWVETKTGFYTDGKLYSMSNTMEFLKFPPLNLIDKFRLGFTIFWASKIKNGRRLEKIPVETWLKRLSGKNTFDKIWLPLLRAKLGEHYKETSASFIWATIQRMYAARRSGLKKEMFGYVKGGYASILRSMENKLTEMGVTIKTTYAATEIINGENSKPLVRFSNGHSETFNKVVITLPSGIAADLCKGLTTEESQKLKKIEYLGVLCASVVLKNSLSPYYVTNITDTWVPFTGIIEMSALVNKKNFNGKTLVYLPKYISSADPLFNETDDSIKTKFITALQRMYPQISNSDIEFIGIARAKKVFALATIDYTDNLPSVETTQPNVYIVNSAQITSGTLNVNETIQVADDFILKNNSKD
jgi:protoporphyrinogen oxidase